LIEKLRVRKPLHAASISRSEREAPVAVILARYARLAGVSADVLIDDKSLLPRIKPEPATH